MAQNNTTFDKKTNTNAPLDTSFGYLGSLYQCYIRNELRSENIIEIPNYFACFHQRIKAVTSCKGRNFILAKMDCLFFMYVICIIFVNGKNCFFSLKPK